MRRKGTKPESSNPSTTPNKSSHMQPISPYQNIKQSPSSYQVTSPVDNAELDYSASFNGEFENTQHNSIPQIISNSVFHQNNIAPNMNMVAHNTLAMTNVNLHINTPLTIPGSHHANQGPRFNANNNSVHRFTARIPPGTKIKRAKPEQNHSGELLPKRDKLMSSDFGHPMQMPSTSFTTNNEFNITNEPVPYNDNLPAVDPYLSIKGENILNLNDPGLSNPPPDYSNLNEIMIECLDSMWAHTPETERNKTIQSIIQQAESWMSELPNLNNHLSMNNTNVSQNADNVDQNGMFNIYQSVMLNVDQNIGNDQIVAPDHEEESVSEELRRMIL